MRKTHAHHSPRPKRVRAPSKRAQGLEPEFTAIPHPLPEGVSLPEDEAGLSIATEDLGSHFLNEAMVPGNSTARDIAELETFLQNESELEPSIDVLLALNELGAREVSGVHPRPKAPERAVEGRKPHAQPAAKSGKPKQRKLHHVARATLRTAAGKLRGLARQLARARRRRSGG